MGVMAINRGDRIEATTATGETIVVRALGSPEPGDLFEIVWVATESEWLRAERDNDEIDGLPWPTESVRELQEV